HRELVHAVPGRARWRRRGSGLRVPGADQPGRLDLHRDPASRLGTQLIPATELAVARREAPRSWAPHAFQHLGFTRRDRDFIKRLAQRGVPELRRLMNRVTGSVLRCERATFRPYPARGRRWRTRTSAP